MSTIKSSFDNGEYFAEKEINEQQPPIYDRQVLYLPFIGDFFTEHNYLEDIGKQNFISWSGNGSYWQNMIQDGTFLGNPIYRVEKSTYDSGYFYAYCLSGLEKIQDAEEYTLTGIFKSSTSNESTQPLASIYQGGGCPWTQGNYTSQYESAIYKYYLGNGWWRYFYTFKINRDKITNSSYINRLYLGFHWSWQSVGTYVWGTQPQLYLGNTLHIYQGNKSAYSIQNIRKYYDGIGFEQPTTNQISTSNMEGYDIGYTGNVCGFSNNFDSRFGQGNWSTEIVYQDNCPIDGITKAQRIITKKSGWGGWTSGNIGNTSGDITYGVLIRLHYGEIQFGDLNTSSRLYINKSYYQQHNKKLGEWLWQVDHFSGTSTGRHLYQNGPTKADIQQVQIYNQKETVGYVNGSAGISKQSLPTDIFEMFKNEFSVQFIYEPLSEHTYGTYEAIFTLNWWTADYSQDWVGIYRGNGWSNSDTITFEITDGTRKYDHSTNISGINSRLNHKLFVQVSYSESQKSFSIYVRDLTQGEDLARELIYLENDFQFSQNWNYQYLGTLHQDSGVQNQKYSHFMVYSKYYNSYELKRLIPKIFGVDKNSFTKVNLIKEHENILERYGPTQFETGKNGGIWSAYTQTNCSVTLEPVRFKQNPYSYFIYRKPNISGSGGCGTGQTCNWGGLKLYFPDDGTFEEEQTYKLSFWYKGYSTHTIQVYFQYEVGWASKGVGLSALNLPSITHTFDDTDGWQYYEETFTIPEGYIHQTGTDGNTYFCMREFKIGYTYTSTDSVGTRLFINDLTIEKISDAGSGKDTYGIKKDGIYVKPLFEGQKKHKVYLLGTQYDTDPQIPVTGNRTVRIDGTDIVNGTGRGLALTIFDENFNLVSNTIYDVYGDDTQRTNLQNQLQQIGDTQYWQLTSFDQVNPNTNLTNQLQKMGSKIWPLSYRSPYQQLGQGKRILYEDGSDSAQYYKHRQVINVRI